jgi:hypothetical protein
MKEVVVHDGHKVLIEVDVKNVMIVGYLWLIPMESTISNGREPKSCPGQVFNSTLGCIGRYCTASAC